MKAKTIVMSLYFVLASTGVGFAAEGAPVFHSNFEEARKVSAESGKPMITIFSATWCPPCQQMKRSVYPSAEVAPYHNSFVWAYLDADEKNNRGLMSKFEVSGIPHISFVASDGQLMGHFAGAVSPADFANILKRVLADHAKGGSGTKPQGSKGKPQGSSGKKGSGSKG